MSTWTDIAGSLTSERIEQLQRKDLPEGYQFSEQEPAFRDIAQDARAAEYLSISQLWNATGTNAEQATQQAVQLESLLRKVETFQVSADPDANPNAERQALLTELAAQRNWLVKLARPYRPAFDTAIDGDLERVRRFAAEIATANQDAQVALESIRSRAADTGAVSAAKLYKDRAEAEDKSAVWFLKGVLGTIGVFTATAWLFFFGPFAADKALDIAPTIAAVAGRTLILAAAAYGVTFCARNYRAHRHLATVNRFKANALEATPLLREGIATDDQRDIIVGELVRAVFTVPDTGFIETSGDSVTIQSPVNALLGGVLGRNQG